MKKFILFLLILTLSLSLSVNAADTADVNCDGRISLSDALLCLHSMTDDVFIDIPDISKDGHGSLADILCILRTCTNKIGTSSRLYGDGSAENPYLIKSEGDLALLCEQVLGYEETEGMHFLQTADIRLQAENWVPIGTSGIPFAGEYDGGGHKIEGLFINTDKSFQGLFGFLTGTVKNLDVYGKVTVHYSGTHSHSFVGGIAGAMNNGAVVSNCKSYVTVEGDSYVGGVVGAILYTDDYITDAFSVIENCSFHGTLIADDRSAINEDAMYFGGIAGRAYGAVRNCVNYGDVKVSGEKTRYIGGITGYAYSPYKGHSPATEQLPALTLENCENRGNVSGGLNVAGIVGQTSLPVRFCTNSGKITGTQYIGGIAGINGTSATYTEGYTVLADCINNGKITVTGDSGGGITGYNFVKVENCKNNGEVLGGTYAKRVGGIAGYSRGDVSACENATAAKITGLQSIGGIVGYFNQANATVQNCKNYAPITAPSKSSEAYYIGGIVGMLGSTNSVLYCKNEGDVTGGGSANTAGTGGIVGALHSGSIIGNCENSGDISAIIRVGGIAGHGKMSKASNIGECYNYGTVFATVASGDAHLGGILGSAISGNITNCTNYGNIQTSGAVASSSYTVGSKTAATVISNVK